jgi:hypothetical protein
MAPNFVRYELHALHNREHITGIYKTIPDLLAAHGERLGLTRRRVETIRAGKPISNRKYKHIVIKDIMPEPKPTNENTPEESTTT